MTSTFGSPIPLTPRSLIWEGSLREELEFDAKANGTYLLHFSNTFSLLTPKNVTLTYDVAESPKLGMEPFVLVWGALNAVCVVVVVVAIVLSMRKPKQEKKSAEPPKSPQVQ